MDRSAFSRIRHTQGAPGVRLSPFSLDPYSGPYGGTNTGSNATRIQLGARCIGLSGTPTHLLLGASDLTSWRTGYITSGFLKPRAYHVWTVN